MPAIEDNDVVRLSVCGGSDNRGILRMYDHEGLINTVLSTNTRGLRSRARIGAMQFFDERAPNRSAVLDNFLQAEPLLLKQPVGLGDIATCYRLLGYDQDIAVIGERESHEIAGLQAKLPTHVRR